MRSRDVLFQQHGVEFQQFQRGVEGEATMRPRDVLFQQHGVEFYKHDFVLIQNAKPDRLPLIGLLLGLSDCTDNDDLSAVVHWAYRQDDWESKEEMHNEAARVGVTLLPSTQEIFLSSDVATVPLATLLPQKASVCFAVPGLDDTAAAAATLKRRVPVNTFLVRFHVDTALNSLSPFSATTQDVMALLDDLTVKFPLPDLGDSALVDATPQSESNSASVTTNVSAHPPDKKVMTPAQFCIGDAVLALRHRSSRTTLAPALAPDHQGLDHSSWKIKDNEHIGMQIAEKFSGKMYLGQVVAWAPAGSAHDLADTSIEWFLVVFHDHDVHAFTLSEVLAGREKLKPSLQNKRNTAALRDACEAWENKHNSAVSLASQSTKTSVKSTVNAEVDEPLWKLAWVRQVTKSGYLYLAWADDCQWDRVKLVSEVRHTDEDIELDIPLSKWPVVVGGAARSLKTEDVSKLEQERSDLPDPADPCYQEKEQMYLAGAEGKGLASRLADDSNSSEDDDLPLAFLWKKRRQLAQPAIKQKLKRVKTLPSAGSEERATDVVSKDCIAKEQIVNSASDHNQDSSVEDVWTTPSFCPQKTRFAMAVDAMTRQEGRLGCGGTSGMH